MPLIKPINSKRRVAARWTLLGAVERSIGYLQGGYYTGSTSIPIDPTTGTTTARSTDGNSAWSKIQLFNCTTQVGTIVYDSLQYRRYCAGVAGNNFGYFSTGYTAPAPYQKFSFATVTASASFSTAQFNQTSAFDLGIYSQAWILCNTVAQSTGSPIDLYYKVNLTNDTPVSQGSLGAGPLGTSRQAMSTATAGFFCNTSYSGLYSLTYATNVVTAQGTNAALDGGIQIPCGMNVNNANYGYIVGLVGRNIKTTVSGATVQSYINVPNYTYNFGESHSLTSFTAGFMMAGYPDTSGRYSSVQHGLCQRITLTTEAVSTMADLILPQSSGQMMEGY